MAKTYQITHVTEYEYERSVTSSYGQLHVLPRELDGQYCLRSGITIDPFPGHYRERLDFFGNRVAQFHLHQPHTKLTVAATSTVTVEDLKLSEHALAGRSWEQVRDAVALGGQAIPDDIVQFLLPSPLVVPEPRYHDYALDCFAPGRGIVESVMALAAKIYADFKYAPGSTSVSTPLASAFKARRGVCQDFSHLALACVRSFGLPGRYVSGYIETDPPPGKEKLQGADGSHSWIAVLIPELGWLGVDPTNNQLAGDRHIVNAVGRDYGDVPPMNGVIYTTGETKSLKVQVDVAAVADASPSAD